MREELPAAFWRVKLGQAHEALVAADTLTRTARAQRGAAVRGAREAGLTWHEIGGLLGVTAARAEQLSHVH